MFLPSILFIYHFLSYSHFVIVLKYIIINILYMYTYIKIVFVEVYMYIYINTLAAAKSLQLCPTLCDPIDGSPPGSPVPGIPKSRTLEWVVISFSNA